jgi:hypothetical protein
VRNNLPRVSSILIIRNLSLPSLSEFLAPLARPILRAKSGRAQSSSQDGNESKDVYLKFFGPPSLSFGAGSNSEYIYFEVEFCGVNNEPFDIAALQDIHVGVGCTPGQHTTWTVTWDKESLKRSDHSLSVMAAWFSLTKCCARCHTSPALQDLSENCWPVLGLAVHAPHASSKEDDSSKSGGSMQVSWVLAQKQAEQTQTSQQKSQYLIHDVFGKAEQDKHGARLCTANTKNSSFTSALGNCWSTAIDKGKGPQINKLNGNKFFPYIQVKSLRENSFKVSFTCSCRFSSLWNALTSQLSPFCSAALQLRNGRGATNDTPQT